MLGRYKHEEADEMASRLRELNADNWGLVPLEPAPCVRVKATGEIFTWSESFACRPDLCENCDIHGNTDPAMWKKTTPPMEETPKKSDEPDYSKVPDIPAPNGLHFYPEQFVTDAGSSVPPIEQAVVAYGMAPEFAETYTTPSATHSPLTIDKIGKGGDSVEDSIVQAFKQRSYI